MDLNLRDKGAGLAEAAAAEAPKLDDGTGLREAAPEPEVHPELTVRLAVYHSPDGKTVKRDEVLTFAPLDRDGEYRRDRIIQSLTAGLDFDKLPGSSQDRFAAIAVCRASVVNPPGWFEGALLDDKALALALAQEVLAHWRAYFRRGFRSRATAPGVVELALCRERAPARPAEPGEPAAPGAE